MTNLCAQEFVKLWTRLEDIVSAKWNIGRGRTSSFQGKDVFFGLLTVTKHGSQWDFMARMFSIKCPTFERIILGFLGCIREAVYESFVLRVGDAYTMDACIARQRKFRSFPMARYATDVTFQQANRPSGNMQEGKKYYSGKHKLYSYKTEVSALPIGVAIGCSLHYPGSIADVDIFYKNSLFHEIALEKSEKGKKTVDIGPLCDEYPNNLAVLVDKVIRGLQIMRELFILKRNQRMGS